MGEGGVLTSGDMKNDMVKLFSQAGPCPGVIMVRTGAVIAIFFSDNK